MFHQILFNKCLPCTYNTLAIQILWSHFIVVQCCSMLYVNGLFDHKFNLHSPNFTVSMYWFKIHLLLSC